MRFASLRIENFRAVRKAHLTDLGDMVVIAGPNGCGKSCLFDAIRLFKTAYGGYNPNEWQQWFNEFQISLERPQELIPLFRDKTLPITIAATVALDASEKKYLRAHAAELLRPIIWQQLSQGKGLYASNQGTSVAAQLSRYGADVDRLVREERSLLNGDLKRDLISGELTIDPSLSPSVTRSPTLQLIYSVVLPEILGIIDYQPAQRSYQREQIGGIDLNVASIEQQVTQHALYNVAGKHQNIKAQMAASYIRELLAKEAGTPVSSRESLIETLKELFRLFFPDKQFLGPRPTPEGRLLFPVRTSAGIEHDVNELSSGEKELLYGYLRIRNLAPKNSVLLLDEPELHLNPRLLRGLPQFYRRHLGRVWNNQIWLLTHSDMLLKESIGQNGVSVFHLLPPASEGSLDNQARPVGRDRALDQALLDLVAEVAAFQPGAKVVIFEGGGDTEFDASMTCELFPELLTAVNTISGTNRGRVRDLHKLLNEASERGALHEKFYSIVDHDSDLGEAPSPARALHWDVYHIENYLLEPSFILQAMGDALKRDATLKTEEQVTAALKVSAEATIGAIVRHDLEDWASKVLVQSIQTSSNPTAPALAPSLRTSVEESVRRLSEKAGRDLPLNKIKLRENRVRKELSNALRSDEWRKKFPGRAIFRHFVGQHVKRLAPDVFRNLVISKMRDAGFQPLGMKQVINTILED